MHSDENYWFDTEHPEFDWKAIDRAVEHAPKDIVHHARAFKRNLDGVVQTNGLPKRMFDAVLEMGQLTASKYGADLKTDVLDHDVSEGTHWLVTAHAELCARTRFNRTAAEIRRQGLVMTWGALEILAGDLFIDFLNAQPEHLQELLADNRCRTLFAIKSVSIETLMEYEFDLSHTIGNILCAHRSIDTLPAMKSVFCVLFPENAALREMLSRRELFALNQRRHLVVHRRGIVDEDYLSKVNDGSKIGKELAITPQALEASICLVHDVGVELLESVAGALRRGKGQHR